MLRESISGSIGNQGGVFPFPWEIQVGANVGQCLRLETTSVDPSSTDLEMVVVSPSGQVYRNDDLATGNRLSLVKVSPAERGWYTVQVSTFDGRPVTANFTLRYGSYSGGNPNCQTPTQPLSQPPGVTVA